MVHKVNSYVTLNEVFLRSLTLLHVGKREQVRDLILIRLIILVIQSVILTGTYFFKEVLMLAANLKIP